MTGTAFVILATAGNLLGLRWLMMRRGIPAAAMLPGPAPSALAGEVGRELLMASAQSPAGGGGGAPSPKPKRQRPKSPSRRAFLRNSMGVAWLGVVGGFGGATLAFLWPSLRGGFGARLEVDSEEAVLAHIQENREPYAFPAGRCYLVEYDAANDPGGAYAEITEGSSIMALYQTCPHLGCKVPWCLSSQWFECPCHGSRYNRWGEYEGGPAPRGMDRFAVSVDEGRLVVDTSAIVDGPSRQGGVLDQPPEGPSCLGG